MCVGQKHIILIYRVSIIISRVLGSIEKLLENIHFPSDGRARLVSGLSRVSGRSGRLPVRNLGDFRADKGKRNDHEVAAAPASLI